MAGKFEAKVIEEFTPVVTGKLGEAVVIAQAAKGLRAHTTRSALSSLRTNGLEISRSRDDKGGTSVYRISGSIQAATP